MIQASADPSASIMRTGRVQQLRGLQQQVADVSNTQDPKVVAQLVQALSPFLDEQLNQLLMQPDGDDDPDGDTEADNPEARWLQRNDQPRMTMRTVAARKPTCPACGHGLTEAAHPGADAASYFRHAMGLPLPATARSGPMSSEARYFVEAMRRSPAALRADELVAQGYDDPARLFTALMAR